MRWSRALQVLAVLTVASACAEDPDHDASPSPTGDGRLVAIEPDALTWLMHVWVSDAHADVVGHRLQLGTLDNPIPTHEIRLGPQPAWPGRMSGAGSWPVVAGPLAGVVTYVTNDGVASNVWVTDATGDGDRQVATIDGVGHTAVMAPDASAAYVMVADRATGTDLGVFRVHLTETGPAELVIPPSADIGDAATILDFWTAEAGASPILSVSPNGRHLARFGCGQESGRCVLDLLHLKTQALRTYVDPPIRGFIWLGDDQWFSAIECPRNKRCKVWGALDLRTGNWFEPARLETNSAVERDDVVVGDDGQLVYLGIWGNHRITGPAELWAFDTRTGDTTTPLSIQGQIWLGSKDFVRVELPRGWTLVSLCQGQRPCNTYAPFALRLADGKQVELELPESFHIRLGD